MRQPLVYVLGTMQGTDGLRDLLEIKPASTHERLPVFLGSPDDIDELLSYGDVQQTSKKTYNI
jgi:fructose-1,6-bisphosphatase I